MRWPHSIRKMKSLYKISAVTTIVMMLLFLFDIIAWIVVGPYPVDAKGWFTLLNDNRLAGLMLLSFATLLGMVLYYLTFLCLYNILRQVNKAYAVLAALFAFVGLTILLVTHIGYPMVHLSELYKTAATESQKIFLLAAGEAQIATAVTSINISGLLVEGAALIFSFLMLRSTIFGKITAYLGIVGHGLDLTHGHRLHRA